MLKLPSFNSYQGGNLKGTYDIFIKLDGVCAYIDQENQTVTSKRGKPLYNFEDILKLPATIPTGYYEVFRKDWDTSVSLVRTQKGGDRVTCRDLHRIYSEEDHYIKTVPFLTTITDPTEEEIMSRMELQVACGNEGLVLWPHEDCRSQKPIKVKPEITVDVQVTAIVEGKGKYQGMLGKLQTNFGDVGTGFTDAQRKELFTHTLIGQIIEVGFMEWTKNNKMRHARFKRVRWDKREENLERND